MKRLVALFLVTLTLPGCGIIGLCSNQCPKGWVHGSADCGCMQVTKSGEQTGAPGEQPGAPVGAVQAACICAYSSGRYGAWFTTRPQKYGQSNVAVRANTCEYLPVCQLIGENYTVISGTAQLSMTQWGEETNLLNGSKIWYAFGFPQHALLEQQQIVPINLRYILKALHFTRVAAGGLTNNSSKACQVECASTIGGGNCLRLDKIPMQSANLHTLYSALLKAPNLISSTDLKAMFQIPGDPCPRGDTSFNNGTFVNNGDGNCTLEASLAGASMHAYIEVPKHVEGSLKSEGSYLQVGFAKGGRANLHFAAPTSASEDDEKEAVEFNSDWGGDIGAISSDGHYAVFSIGASSCARVKLL